MTGATLSKDLQPSETQEVIEVSDINSEKTGFYDPLLIKSLDVPVADPNIRIDKSGRPIIAKRGRPRKEPEPQLSDFETAFVNSYLDPSCGYDSRAAVIKAGHQEKGSKDLGLKLMADVRILRAIELGRKKLAVSVATSRIDMLRKIEAFLAIAMEKKDPTGAARLLSLEIGMLGYNEPVKMDITGSINLSFGSGEPIIVGSKNPDRYDDAEDTDVSEETGSNSEDDEKDFTNE